MESFYEWLETHPSHYLFQILMLEKECNICYELDNYGNILFINNNGSKHPLATLLNGQAFKCDGSWKHLGKQNENGRTFEPAILEDDEDGNSGLSGDEPQDSLKDTSE